RNGHARFAMGRQLMQWRQFALSKPHLQAAADLMPDFAPAFLTLAQVQAQLGDGQGALKSAAAAMRLDPNNAQTRGLMERLGGR
ncbi:MAG: hypothetical protein VYD05_15100, partial [Planctomycetota bacterium]|nr:hypothetical protein [Planctomycetota bacterium]